MPFIDLHAHYPMHTIFPPMPFENPEDKWKKALFDTMNTRFNYESGEPRVSLERWYKDDADLGVTGLGSVLYGAQDEFFVKTGPDPIPEAICHIYAQWKNVEDEICLDGRVQIARNPKQVRDFIASGQRFLFHMLEGGFSVGGNAANVKTLARMGIASIIPAHMLYRGVATCENAFPPLLYPFFKNELDEQPCIGLSLPGEQIVEESFRNKIIVDITHASRDAQKQIFDIAGGYRDRPVISSHNSVRGVSDAGLNLSDGAILRIKASRGVIGVLFYPHWLRRQHELDFRDDFRLVTDVIDYIYCITCSYENIAIGSDLDGFIDPIQTCSNYSKMSRMAIHLRHKYGEKNAEMILYRNALRVLEEGWAGTTESPKEWTCDFGI
jgi:microsomal dipeptidase-like Zn-dependent dipeptidase